MNKYIDAEKLIAEIERRRLSNRYTYTEDYENELLGIITSLQQEQSEADLEKEIDDYYHANLGLILSQVDTKVIVSEIARHFFELGKNTRKEE